MFNSKARDMKYLIVGITAEYESIITANLSLSLCSQSNSFQLGTRLFQFETDVWTNRFWTWRKNFWHVFHCRCLSNCFQVPLQLLQWKFWLNLYGAYINMLCSENVFHILFNKLLPHHENDTSISSTCDAEINENLMSHYSEQLDDSPLETGFAPSKRSAWFINISTIICSV